MRGAKYYFCFHNFADSFKVSVRALRSLDNYIENEGVETYQEIWVQGKGGLMTNIIQRFDFTRLIGKLVEIALLFHDP